MRGYGSKNGMPPEKMQTPVFDSAMPRKKMRMAERLEELAEAEGCVMKGWRKALKS
jgi:hypothetical protein